jgi:hypothetical protein
MEIEGSLPCLQKLTTGLYPEAVQSSSTLSYLPKHYSDLQISDVATGIWQW